MLGISTFSKGQAKILAALPKALAERKPLIIPSGHAQGKDWICSAISLWFLYNHSPAKVLITAPTDRQVKEIMWAEIEKRWNGAKIKLDGRLLVCKVDIEEDWFLIGFTTKETGNMTGKFQGFHCLSEDTEILTKRGFKTIDEIDINDFVLSPKVGEKTARWEPIDNIFKYPFEGKINTINNRAVSFSVTDEHRFPTKYSVEHGTLKLKNFSELKKQFVIQRIISWKGNDFIVPKPFSDMDKRKFAEFLGFWTGDGGTREHYKTKRFYEVILYQKKEKIFGYIENLIKGFRWHRGKDYWSISDRGMAEWLVKNIGRYGKDRIVPRNILDANPEIMEAYLQGFWMAEGSFYKNGEKRQAYNTSKNLMDGVQEMLLKLGKPAKLCVNHIGNNRHNPCYCISYVTTKGDSVVKKNKVKKEYYSGRVWCVSTKNSTFVARRDGKCFVSGNSPNIMVIVSEAQAVPDQIFKQIDGILTGGNRLLIMIGNPLRTTGTFAKSIKNTTDNIVIHLSCLDSPNYVHRRDVIPGMASYDWVEKMRKQYGPEHPEWYGRVTGQLPPISIDSIFNPDLVDKMLNSAPRITVRKIVTSCDPALFGDDDIVIYGMECGRIIKEHIQCQAPADAVCSQILQVTKAIHSNHIAIDSSGLGGPIAHFLSKMKPEGVTIQEINSSSKAEDEEHYQNLKAEMWFYAKDQAEKGYVNIPDDDYLKEELIEMRYFYNPRGKIQIEKKEDLKARIGRSPDRADAWVMAVWATRSANKIRITDSWAPSALSSEVMAPPSRSEMTA
jgi:hypothetical protein